MADSISIKDKKMQKFESKKLGRENQERADKEIRGMEAEVDSGSRSSRIKSLSAAKKKEMLEEYEKVIKKLKELELRNKKKENFKHSFKGLKYFPTLNGHSVYSESMQVQAKADKESISAMMAYGQLGAGFEVTFEQFMVHVRSERRQEFLSLCKNNSTLSHNLMGMGKVLQFYNQRDFTRAYAAMVFFGLENSMDLMETFLKVKFNADFKMQVNKFKEQVANASVFEEKAIREEAGTNVFSQHDSQMTSMQSSYYGKSVSDTIQYNSVYGIKTKEVQKPEEEIKVKAETYRNLMEKHNGNKMGVAAEAFLIREEEKIKKREEITKEIKSEVKTGVTTVLSGKVEDKEISETENYLSTIKTNRYFDKSYSNSIYSNSYNLSNSANYENFRIELDNATDPNEAEDIKKRRREFTESVIFDKLIEILDNRMENENKKKRDLLSEKAEITEKLNMVTLSADSAQKLKDRLLEIDEELASIKPPEIMLREALSASGRPPEELIKYNSQFSSILENKSRIKIDYSKPLTKRNGFDAFLNENKFNKNALQKMLYEKKKELEEALSTPGKESSVSEILSQISKIEKHLNSLERSIKHAALAQNATDEKNILRLLSGEKEFSLNDFNLIINIVDKAQFEKLIGRELSKVEFALIRQNGFNDEHFKIADEETLIKLLMRKLANTYASQIENSLSPDENVFEQAMSNIDEKIAVLDGQISQLKTQQKSAESGEEKATIGRKIGELQSKIKLLRRAKDTILERQKVIEEDKQKQAQEKTKSPEEILENQLEHVVKRKLTTNIGDKDNPDIRYIDELSDEQLKDQGMSIDSVLNSVKTVFDSLERIIGLDLESITQGDMNRTEDGLRRATSLLERLKWKIPESDYEVLKAKSEWLLKRVKTLSNIVVKESSEKASDSPEVPTVESKEEEPSFEESATVEKSGSDELFAETQGATIGEVAGRSGATSTKGKSENEQENEIVINFKPNS